MEDKTKKLKILTGKNCEEVMEKYTEFEKEHTVIDIKQHTATTMFVFYDDTVKVIETVQIEF